MPQGKAKTYARVMREVFDGVSEKEAKQRVQVLKRLLYKRGDFKHVSKILQEFARAWRERKGKPATVVTAQPLAERTKGEMEKSLERKGYVLEERIDPAGIGGTALFLGNDYVIDSTMRGKLRRLEEVLTKKF